MSRTRHAQTIRQAVSLEGRGLHSNRMCRVVLHPVERPSGIRFVHSPSGVEIPATVDRVGDLSLATTLVEKGVRIGTIEHLLSALAGLELENVNIEVNAEELPILDGSAGPWVDLLMGAGRRVLPGARRMIKVLDTVEVRRGDKWMRVSPHPTFRLRYTLDYSHTAIGRQSRELSLNPEKYRRELATARTFCLEQDIEMMRSKGLALGGSLDNAVVYGQDGPLNESLRFEDEAIRHKMMDLVGDLALLGSPLEGLVEAHAAGHAMHVALAKQLLETPSAWTYVDTAESVEPWGLLIPSQHSVPMPA